MKTTVETLLWSLMSHLLLARSSLLFSRFHVGVELLGGWRSLSVGASSGLEPGLDSFYIHVVWHHLELYFGKEIYVSAELVYTSFNLTGPFTSVQVLHVHIHTTVHMCVDNTPCIAFAPGEYDVLNLTGWIKTSTQSIWHELKPREDGGPLSRVSCGCTDVPTEPHLFWVVWVPEGRGRPVLQWEVVKRVSGINPICSVSLLHVFFFVSIVLVSRIRHSCELCCVTVLLPVTSFFLH